RIPSISWRLLHLGGRPDFLPLGSNGSRRAHCWLVRSPRPMPGASHGTPPLLKHALVPVIWRAGQESMAVAVAISGGVFVATGFVSNATETALIWVADANQPVAVLALDQLQGRTPVVWTITAL